MGGAIWDFVSTGITEKVRTLKDGSGNNVQVNVMGRAKLVPGVSGKGIDLNGHDQWVEVYRDEALEISGDQLTLTLMGISPVTEQFCRDPDNQRKLAVWNSPDKKRFT